MIEQIFIHIGVHKTGSTTIQESLGRKREALKSHGFLYPVFMARKADILNHSVPFASMFMSKPEAYLENKVNKITTRPELERLHQDYELQLADQIEIFDGNKLIISGEDICRFTIDQLEQFKSFLTRLTSSNANIQIVIFCRYPVKWLSSMASEYIVGQGLTLKNCLSKGLLSGNYYKQLIANFSEVFGNDSITVLLYENAILHPSGPTGALLEVLGAEDELIDQFKNERFNSASSYEAISIFSAIHETLPDVDGLPYSFQGKTRELLINLPGKKFVLPIPFQRKIWELSKADVDWLCKTFLLPYYQYGEEEIPAISERWGAETLKYLHQVMLSLPDSVKKAILDVLLDELKVHKREFTLGKKRELFGFLMHYSLYLQTGSRFGKLKYFVNKLGIVQGLFHSGLFYLSKRSNRLRHENKKCPRENPL